MEGRDGAADVPAPGLYLDNETGPPRATSAGTFWGQERPIRSEPGQNNGDRAKVVRGPSRVHGGALTSVFGPARLIGDGWVCDMALGRLSCARIGDGDVVRPAVVGAAQITPRRVRGPHVAVARRDAVLEDGPGRLNVVRSVDELRERPRRVLVVVQDTPNWSEPAPRPPDDV